MIGEILIRYLINSIYGGAFIALVVLIRLAAKDRVPRKYTCILWLVAALRLIVPVSVESTYGVLPQITFGHLNPVNVVWHSYINDSFLPVAEYDADQTVEAGEINTERTEIDDQNDTEYITETPITNPTVSAFAGMKRMTSIMKNSLSKAGISIEDDGKLSISEDTFKKADFDKVKTVFSGKNSYADIISNSASRIASAASTAENKYGSVAYGSDGTYGSYNSYYSGLYYNGFF